MRHGRTDANQKEIVKALRDVPGCSVEVLCDVGGGVPDLLIGIRNRNFLLECKDGNKPPSKRKLTDDQIVWHRDWQGQKAVVKNIEEALDVIRL